MCRVHQMCNADICLTKIYHVKKLIFFLALFALSFVLPSCTENLSNGSRVGFVTQIAQSGLIFKTWEGHLNTSQTGMNTAKPFDFSIDRQNEPKGLVATLDSAAEYGWKVKLTYHQVSTGRNWFDNRGETNYFVTSCEVRDRHPMEPIYQTKPAHDKNESI